MAAPGTRRAVLHGVLWVHGTGAQWRELPERYSAGSDLIVAVAADNSLPIAVSVQSAPPAECQLVEAVLVGSFLDEFRPGSSATKPATPMRSTKISKGNTVSS